MVQNTRLPPVNPGMLAVQLAGVRMNTNVEILHGDGAAWAAGRQRVLRNTYALLALSMLPTVLGAWIGLQTGIASALSPMVGLIVFMAGAFGFIYAIEKNKDSGLGVALLLGFTFFMGVMLSRLLAIILSRGNGAALVMTAFAGTSVVFFGMAALSSVIKRDLSGLGRFLFIGMIMLLVAMIANIFIQSSALMITLAVLAIGIFSAFILHDLKRVRDGEETNYVTATLGVYLSLYNVFQNLLMLLGIFGGDD
jgi:modulator of FtsH protease